jgi:hypothetical protein
VRWPAAILIALLLSGHTPQALATTSVADSCGSARAADSLSAAEVAFDRARNAWTSPRYPATFTFTVRIHALDHGVEHVAHYTGEEDVKDGQLFTDRFSEEEIAHPYVTRGTDVTIGISVYGQHSTVKKLTKDEPSMDILGAPHLSPRYSFGLRKVSNSQAPPAADDAMGAKLIGKTSSVVRNYEIHCNVQSTAQGDELHLTLEPLHNPRGFRLRELWLDPLTFASRRLRTAGNFSGGPPLGVDWLTTFRQIDGAFFIEKEVALSNLDYLEGRVYEGATIEFDHITPLEKPTRRTQITQVEAPKNLREPSQE